jgi:hypothetical protein
VECENFIFRPVDVEGLVHFPDRRPSEEQAGPPDSRTLVYYKAQLIDIPDPQRRLYYFLRRTLNPQAIVS